jgi:hypothetical protein
MISNSDIQAGWISKLKANMAITALVPAVEVREDLYKSTVFTYPNIRVKLGNLVPKVYAPNCQIFSSEVSILVFTEQKSSKQADDIAGVIATQFWGGAFTVNGVRFSGITLEALVPAIVPERDENSWAAEVKFVTTVSSG